MHLHSHFGSLLKSWNYQKEKCKMTRLVWKNLTRSQLSQNYRWQYRQCKIYLYNTVELMQKLWTFSKTFIIVWPSIMWAQTLHISYGYLHFLHSFTRRWTWCLWRRLNIQMLLTTKTSNIYRDKETDILGSLGSNSREPWRRTSCTLTKRR